MERKERYEYYFLKKTVYNYLLNIFSSPRGKQVLLQGVQIHYEAGLGPPAGLCGIHRTVGHGEFPAHARCKTILK